MFEKEICKLSVDPWKFSSSTLGKVYIYIFYLVTSASKTHNESHNLAHLPSGPVLEELFTGLATRWQYSFKNK